MTPKEKAKELVFKYENLVTVWDCYNDEPLELKCRLSDMKKCGLICVNEILGGSRLFYIEDYTYWKEVKQEINKL